MTYTCPYCRRPSTGEGASCPNCGAPVDITLRTTAGGWTELPPIADMARIQVGHSQVEVSGRSVPAAEWTLAAGEGVYFPHHVLLWQEPSVELAPMSMPAGAFTCFNRSALTPRSPRYSRTLAALTLLATNAT